MRNLAPMVAVMGLFLFCSVSTSAQKLNVKIIDRQDKEDEYAYVAVYNNVAVGKSFKVHGATFTLQLPDGRVAIVNCESKFAEHMAGRVGNRRSCRTPLVDSIQADFNGDNAKLIWSVSLDGKKIQSETYKVLAILGTPSQGATTAHAPLSEELIQAKTVYIVDAGNHSDADVIYSEITKWGMWKVVNREDDANIGIGVAQDASGQYVLMVLNSDRQPIYRDVARSSAEAAKRLIGELRNRIAEQEQNASRATK